MTTSGTPPSGTPAPGARSTGARSTGARSTGAPSTGAPSTGTPAPETPAPETPATAIPSPETEHAERASALERRIEELEIRNAHQEYALQGLGEELVHLQQANTQLTRQLQALVERMAALDTGGPGGDPGAEPPPPHY